MKWQEHDRTQRKCQWPHQYTPNVLKNDALQWFTASLRIELCDIIIQQHVIRWFSIQVRHKKAGGFGSAVGPWTIAATLPLHTEISSYRFEILTGITAVMPFKYQSDWQTIKQNLTASILYEINGSVLLLAKKIQGLEDHREAVATKLSPKFHLKIKCREILLVHAFLPNSPIILKFCIEHGSDTAVLCAKFKMIGQLTWMVGTNEMTRDLS